MSDFGITEKSRPLVVTAYQPQWVDDFRQIATRIRDLVGNTAVRIDHIGSTAVPGLAAKDVIDTNLASRLGQRLWSDEPSEKSGVSPGHRISVRRVSQQT